MPSLRVGIIGGGPAGLVGAVAGRRAGFEVTVFERVEAFRRVVGGIAIQNNGLRVLATIGVLDELHPQLHRVRGVRVEGIGGKRLVEYDFSRMRTPFPWMAVLLRSDLEERLAIAAQRAGAQLLLGRTAEGVLADSGRAIVRLAGGDEHEFDVVIGADGISSVVRESVGLGSRKRTANRAYLRGVSPVQAERDVVQEIWGADGRRFGLAPVGDDLAYFYCSVEVGGWARVLEGGGIDDWISSWEPYGPTVSSTLRSVEDWHVVNYDEVREIQLRSWARPPVFLVGDAAHAMTPDLGQGANSAMVDALIVARLLHEGRERSVSLEEVARRYLRLRRRFVWRTQVASRAASSMSGASGTVARVTRHLALRLQDRLGPLKRQTLVLAAGQNPKESDLLEKYV